MVAVIGQRKAEVSLTTGKLYTTDEALQIGLVDESASTAESALNQGTQFLNNFQRISRKYCLICIITCSKFKFKLIIDLYIFFSLGL